MSLPIIIDSVEENQYITLDYFGLPLTLKVIKINENQAHLECESKNLIISTSLDKYNEKWLWKCGWTLIDKKCFDLDFGENV